MARRPSKSFSCSWSYSQPSDPVTGVVHGVDDEPVGAGLDHGVVHGSPQIGDCGMQIIPVVRGHHVAIVIEPREKIRHGIRTIGILVMDGGMVEGKLPVRGRALGHWGSR